MTAALSPWSSAAPWPRARAWWSKESRCGRGRKPAAGEGSVLRDLQDQLAEVLAREQSHQGFGECLQALHDVFLAFHAAVLQVERELCHGDGEALGIVE